jgi:hypothetical protein
MYMCTKFTTTGIYIYMRGHQTRLYVGQFRRLVEDTRLQAYICYAYGYTYIHGWMDGCIRATHAL